MTKRFERWGMRLRRSSSFARQCCRDIQALCKSGPGWAWRRKTVRERAPSVCLAAHGSQVYLPRNARALMRARQLGGQIKYLSQGEIEARNRGYSPYSVETWRTWEYWANVAGCGQTLTRTEDRIDKDARQSG